LTSTLGATPFGYLVLGGIAYLVFLSTVAA
jgi:hypothetical protein